MVTITVRGERFELPDDQATVVAEELRRTAAGEFGDRRHGIGGARPLADALELRLVGERDDPVVLDRDQALALFDYLNVAGTPGDPLYLAVRAVHDSPAP